VEVRLVAMYLRGLAVALGIKIIMLLRPEVLIRLLLVMEIRVQLAVNHFL
jgi:hypothetical protein